MDRFDINRIVWQDGDIITQNHFQIQERWIENLIGISSQSIYKYGFIRNPILQDSYNSRANISVSLIEGSQYRVDIERFQVTNPVGQIIKIDERRSFVLNAQIFKRDSEGFILVYLIVSDIDYNNSDAIDRISDEVITGIRTYFLPCELSTSNNNGLGVPIFRFKVDGNHLNFDETYIPYGITLDSHHTITKHFTDFIDIFNHSKKIVTEYFLSHSSRPGLPFIWQVATGLYRIVMRYNSFFNNSTHYTADFIQTFISFVNEIKAEINIFVIGYNQDYYRQQYVELVEQFDIPIIRVVEQQIDLTYSFQRIKAVLETFTKFLGILPEGLDVEKILPVKDVKFDKVAGFNRIKVYLEKEFEFKMGETLMTIELHSFTRSEPINRDLRVTLGDVPAPMLKDLRGLLAPIKGEELSYRIECPKEVINRNSESLITLYLPTPLGEGVPDLKKYVAIKVRGVNI